MVYVDFEGHNETVCLTKFDIRQAETHLLPVVRNLSTFGLFG